MLRKTKGDVVATVSTSRMLDDITADHGVVLHRTKVGVGWVVEKMHAVNAAIGGEGTGGVIYPNIHYTTDGIASIAAIAQYLAESGSDGNAACGEHAPLSDVPKEIGYSVTGTCKTPYGPRFGGLQRSV